MPHAPLSYTNHQNSTAYIRAVPAKKGGLRYYITKDPKAPDLIEEMPEGFEFHENPEDARIIFRKRKACHILPAERQMVEDAVANLSAVSDFVVEAREKEIVVYISQFSSIEGREPSLSAEEAREAWGKSSDRWKKYDDYVRFVLVSKSPPRVCGGADCVHGFLKPRLRRVRTLRRLGILGRENLRTHRARFVF